MVTDSAASNGRGPGVEAAPKKPPGGGRFLLAVLVALVVNICVLFPVWLDVETVVIRLAVGMVVPFFAVALLGEKRRLSFVKMLVWLVVL